MNVKSILAAMVLIAPLPMQLEAGEPPAFDRLLPASTHAFVSIADLKGLHEAWQETDLAALGDQEFMKPFLDSAKSGIEAARRERPVLADLGIEELQAAATGGICLAAVETSASELAVVALLSVEGDAAAVKSLIDRIDTGLKRRLATHAARTTAAGVVHVYDWKSRDGAARQGAYFLHGDLLAVTDDASVAELMLARVHGPAEGGLATVAAYRYVMDRCQDHASELAPQIRWYADPLRIDRLASGEESEFAKKHGFESIKAVGGTINLDQSNCEILSRVAVYAPRPHTNAMRLVSFVAGTVHGPPDWVLDDVDSYSELNLELATLVNSVGGLFDELVADGAKGTFEDILNDLKLEDGPEVDIRGDLLPIIGPRVQVISDHLDRDAGPDADNSCTLIAIATSNEKAAAEIVKRLMKDDPEVVRSKLPGYDFELFQVKDTPTATMPNLGMMVANKNILIASHAELIRKLLLAPFDAPKLKHAADYARFNACLEALGGGDAEARSFARPGREYATTYGTARAGKLNDYESPVADLLGLLFGPDENRLTGFPELDFSTLPALETLRPHLNPHGTFVKSQENGWLIETFIPRKVSK